MVALYVGGQKIGLLADLERLLPQIRATGRTVDILDDAGRPLGTIRPQAEPDGSEPLVPWEPGVTREELDRRAAEPGLTYDEVKARLGWK